jgi:hypothetical protein
MIRGFKKQKYVVISEIGPHAGESEEEILNRKGKEIKDIGKSFWLHKSYSAKPNIVQNLCENALKERNIPVCIFIQASSKNGARPTKKDDKMKEFSLDQKYWEKIPLGIKVTGLSKNAFIMIFKKLNIIKKEQYLNLWDYSLFESSGKAVRMGRGASTVCCVKESSNDDPNKMKSNPRKIVAIGEFFYPFTAWVR